MEEKLRGLTERLRRIDRRQMCAVERAVSALGIVPSQHFALMQLSKAERAVSQAEVARMLHVSPARVTLVMKGLESEGYVERASADGRRYEISITPKGVAMVNSSRALFCGLNRACYAGFSDGELDALAGYLDRILDNLSLMEEEDKRGGE